MFQECSLSSGWFQLSMFPDQATITVIQYNVTCNVIFGTPNLHRCMASIRSWNVQGSVCIVGCTVSDRYYFIIVVLIIESEIVHDMDFVIHFHRRKQIRKTDATVQLAIISVPSDPFSTPSCCHPKFSW